MTAAGLFLARAAVQRACGRVELRDARRLWSGSRLREAQAAEDLKPVSGGRVEWVPSQAFRRVQGGDDVSWIKTLLLQFAPSHPAASLSA